MPLVWLTCTSALTYRKHGVHGRMLYVHLVYHVSKWDRRATYSSQCVYALRVASDLAVSGLIPRVWGPPPPPGGAQNNKKELCM